MDAGRLQAIATEIGALVEQKNRAYGDAFSKCGDFLKLLYPDGIQPEQYGDALCLVRIFDKQMRIATDKQALGENPYRDIAGYGILGAAKGEEEQHATGAATWEPVKVTVKCGRNGCCLEAGHLQPCVSGNGMVVETRK
jgi:hypothetical protein